MGKSRRLKPSETRRGGIGFVAALPERLGPLLGWPGLIAVGFLVAATLVVRSGDDRFLFALNDNLDQPVFARVAFELVSEQRTAEVRRKQQQMVPDHYRLNQGLADRIKGELLALHAAVNAAADFAAFETENPQRWTIDNAGFDAVKSLMDEAGSNKFKKDVDALTSRLAQKNMIEHDRRQPGREMQSDAPDIMVDRGDGNFVPVSRVSLAYAINPVHVADLAEDLVGIDFAKALRPALHAIIARAIVPGEGGSHYEPVLMYDEENTDAEIARIEDAPPVMDTFKRGDRVVSAGEVNGQRLALLQAEHVEFLRQRSVDSRLRSEWRKHRLGLAGAVLLLTVGLSLFVSRTERRIVENPVRALALAMLLLSVLLADRLMIAVGNSVMWSVGPLTVAAAVLTVTYGQRFAIGVTSLLAVLTVLTLDASIGLLLVLLSVTCVTVALLWDIRTRLKLVEVGAVTASVAGLSAIFVGLIDTQSGMAVVAGAAYAALAALAGTSVILVLLPVIERAFGIATSLTLLEWADTSNPLLKQLIQKAPGTWQHSHLLGSMAESAAEEVGANGLLVRVGAYYHDIGKMCKPAYFVENQQANMNAHDGLSPTMSLLVILAHVKDGLAIAKEHGLPPVLNQFIAEHHGTTVVRYFHAMATQEARPTGKHDREVSEAEFRYPGPKPRTRESVILMLCDSVEGAVRSLQDPTPGRIESKVHEIVMARLLDGQVDNCDITLKELARVEQSLVRSLCAIHHGRIAYPTAGEANPSFQVARSA